MKNKFLIIGILLLINNVYSCTIDSVYEDEFNDGNVNYEYWINTSSDNGFSESADRLQFHKSYGRVYGKYTGNLANSDIDTSVLFYYGYTSAGGGSYGKPYMNISDGKWGIYCEGETLTGWDLKCKPINNNATTECNNYAFQSSNGISNLTTQISLNAFNFSYGDIFIQCNNSFLKDSSDITWHFSSASGGALSKGYIYFYDFTHENQTKYTKLTWNTLNCMDESPIEDLNITVTHVQNSRYPPIPQNCLTDENGECVFLFDYFCNMSCDEVVMVEADLVDIYERTPSVPYDMFGIGRDENSEHSVITYHTMSMASHMVEFNIQDYSHIPISNVSVEVLQLGGIVGYCNTNISGKCKISLVSDVLYTLELKKSQYKTQTDIILLTQFDPYNIERTYYLKTRYVNECDLRVTGWNISGNTTGLNGSEIIITYISGYPEYEGFSWILNFNNSLAIINGLPKGYYRATINDIIEYCFIEDSISVESMDFILENSLEYQTFFIRECGYEWNFSGHVYTSYTWDDWNNKIYNASTSTEITLYNNKYSHITHTNAEGYFLFDNVTQGRYTIHIRHDGVHQEFFGLIDIDNNLYKKYFLVPLISPEYYNYSVSGYILYNGTPIPNVDILLQFDLTHHEYEFEYNSDSTGYYNFTTEIPITTYHELDITYNIDSYPEYYTYYRVLGVSKDSLGSTNNISLSKKNLLWTVIGNFVDKDNNPVSGDIAFRNLESNLTYVNFLDNSMEVFNCRCGDYKLILSGYFRPQEQSITLPDNVDTWISLDGVWDLGNIMVNPVTGFCDLKVITVDNETNTIEDVIINLKDTNNYFDKNQYSNLLGESIFVGIPNDIYIITVEKTGYKTSETKFLTTGNQPMQVTIKMDAYSITVEDSIEDIIEEWGYILVCLITVVIFLFFGSMVFEFMDKIGGK